MIQYNFEYYPNETYNIVARKNKKIVSSVNYNLEHIDSTENQLGFYKLNITSLNYIKNEKESVFYLVKSILKDFQDRNLKQIKFPIETKKNRFMKYTIFFKFNEYEIVFE